MSFGKGQKLPIHHVNCRDCGVAIQRKSYWRNPSCRDCSKKRGRSTHEVYLKRLRQEARRYRILLAVGPYKSYEELYRALKVRNPRGWAQSLDAGNERRAE